MSYILDALKKSEAERRAAAPAGGVSGAVYVVDAAPGFTGWRPLGLAALVLVLLAVVALWPGEQRSAAIVTAPPVPTNAEAPPALPVDPPARESTGAPVAVAASQFAGEPAVDPGAPPRSDSGDTPLLSPVPAVKAVAADRDSPPRATRRPSAVTAKTPRSAATVSTPTTSAPAASLPATSSPPASASVVSRTAGAAARSGSLAPVGTPPEAVRAAAVAPSPTAVAAPAAAGVAGVATTPAAPQPVQETASADAVPGSPPAGELPRLVVSGFAGGEDRDARFAVINDRIVREGEEFAPDLRLTHVGQDGVVVEYRGKRYRP